MPKQGEKTQAEIFDLLTTADKPMSAYEILAAMRPNYEKLAPPTIYRALTALTDQKRIHRIESTNAYMACCSDHPHDEAVIAICDDCGTVEEQLEAGVVESITAVTNKSGFQPKKHVIEVHGTCASCLDEAI